jgi:TonB family protein
MIELLNYWGDLWLEYFGWIVLQNTFFMGLILFVLYLLKNSSAQIKYIISLIGLIKLLLPPFLPITILINSFNRFNISNDPIFAITSIEVAPILNLTSNSLNLNGLLLLFWILIVTALILIPLFITIKLKFKLNKGLALPLKNLNSDFDKLFITVYKTNKINIPLTLGVFPKKIYVPVNWDKWSNQCQQMVLKHEFAHIKRKDGLFQIIQILVCAIYFFHPLVWLFNQRINEYREMACDDFSSEGNKSTSIEYARILVNIADELIQTRLNFFSTSNFIIKKNELLKRVQYLTKEAKMNNLSKIKVCLVLFGLLLLIVSLSWTKTDQYQTKTIRSSTITKETNNQIKPGMTGKIAGTVKDHKTKIFLIGTKVFLDGTNFSALTDQKGNFYLSNIPEGVYRLKASHLGFKTVIISNIRIQRKKTTHLDLLLEKVVIVTPHDKLPQPVGGFKAIQEELIYPEIALKTGIQGRVIVYAHISNEGKVLNTKVVESIDPEGCDIAAVNAIKSVQWEPAMQEDKAVNVWISVPITFKLKH